METVNTLSLTLLEILGFGSILVTCLILVIEMIKLWIISFFYLKIMKFRLYKNISCVYLFNCKRLFNLILF